LTVDPLALVLLLGLGTWSALDGTSVGQVLLSRPLVSGTLAGAILGDPALGLLVGALLEAVHLVDFPVGAVRLPEPGPGAVPGVAAAFLLGGAGGLALGVGLGTLLGRLAGYTIVRLRHLNERILAGILEGPVTPGGLSRRHWLCVGADAARGGVLTTLGLAVALAIPPAVAGWWPLSRTATVALLLLPAGLSVGAMARRWSRTRVGKGGLVAGIVAGAIVGLVLGG
jgi:hypothetical protein